jgi:ABC-type glutathione transport system ATPase component
MPDSVVTARDLRVRYHRHSSLLASRRQPAAWAVDGVSFEVAAGESFALVGESGCGKSTLARTLVGLTKATEGTVTLGGVEVGHRRTSQQRRTIQLVFQDPYSSLNPRMTVGQAIEEVLQVHRMREGGGVAARMHELLDLVHLPSTVADSSPRQLSGGQRQRVSIARALAAEPKVLVADEPVSALDVSVQAAVLNLFADLRSELGLTLLMISHNLAVVRHVSERIAVMHAGRLVEVGATHDVLERPSHDYTRRLLASVPSLVPRVRPSTTTSLATPAEGHDAS